MREPEEVPRSLIAGLAFTAGRDPGHWYQNAEDRRAVLDTWLQVLVPFLSEYQPEPRS